MLIKGRVWKYGDNVNTDQIFPGKYTYTITDPVEMAAHAMEDIDPEFAKGVRKGDIVVAGRNFGCGSSREQAVTALKYAGIAAVVAESFARIYYRNLINSGLPAIICPGVSKEVEKGDEIIIDFNEGTIKFKDRVFVFPPLLPKMQEILQAGGLIPYIKAQLKKG